MNQKTIKQGGARPGAGRKPSPEALKAITVRLPVSLVERLKERGITETVTAALVFYFEKEKLTIKKEG